jgi:hypothetical protein
MGQQCPRGFIPTLKLWWPSSKPSNARLSEKQMFRKRHVQIGPVALTMARNDALSFYGKDRHVHG